jgi:hypothetical protein
VALFLGKKAPEFHAGLALAKTFSTEPAPDKAIDWSGTVTVIPMLGNDTCGCCTIATSLHHQQFITNLNGAPEMPDASCCIDNYSRASGYDPATQANDNGLSLLAKNMFWMNDGFAISANGAFDKLDAFAQIEEGDLDTLTRMLAIFGPQELGVELPTGADEEFYTGFWKDTSAAPGSLGGHDTLLVGVTAVRDWFRIATWNGYVMASRDWMLKYMSEGTALLRRNWINKTTNLSPSGYSMQALDQLIQSQRGILGLGAL